MKDVVIRFFQMEVLTDHPLIYWALLLVWCLLLASAWSSLRNFDGPTWMGWIWMVFILAVPIAGLGIYTLRCLIKADWSFLKPLSQSRSAAVRAVTNPSIKPRP